MRNDKISRNDLRFIDWTPEKLKEVRRSVGMSQQDVANLFDVTRATISHIERGKIHSPLEILAYEIALERMWALQQGYVPAYRKIGTNQFMEENQNGKEISA